MLRVFNQFNKSVFSESLKNGYLSLFNVELLELLFELGPLSYPLNYYYNIKSTLVYNLFYPYSSL